MEKKHYITLLRKFASIKSLSCFFEESHVLVKYIVVSLSKDVFERGTSIGSGLFSFLDGGFTQIFGQIVSLTVKTLRNTNLVVSRCFKMRKNSLPVEAVVLKYPETK